MPHIKVSMVPGRSKELKEKLAEALASELCRVFGCEMDKISVSLVDVPTTEWAEKIVKPEIIDQPDTVYKKPGYKY